MSLRRGSSGASAGELAAELIDLVVRSPAPEDEPAERRERDDQEKGEPSRRPLLPCRGGLDLLIDEVADFDRGPRPPRPRPASWIIWAMVRLPTFLPAAGAITAARDRGGGRSPTDRERGSVGSSTIGRGACGFGGAPATRFETGSPASGRFAISGGSWNAAVGGIGFFSRGAATGSGHGHEHGHGLRARS